MLQLDLAAKGRTGYEPFGDLVPTGHASTTPDPPAVPTVPGHAAPSLRANLDGRQLVQLASLHHLFHLGAHASLP